MLLVIALGSAGCAPDSEGTFSLSMSGALNAQVTGRATAVGNHWLSDNGPGYTIALRVPSGITGLEKYVGGAVLLVSESIPATGEYRPKVAGDKTDAGRLSVFVTGTGGNPVWHGAGGIIKIKRGFRWTDRVDGTFRIKVVSSSATPDTLTLTGSFLTR